MLTNGVFYGTVKSQHEIVCILVYTKMANTDKSKKKSNFTMFTMSDLKINHLYTAKNT
jgi:hypothetical protein